LGVRGKATNRVKGTLGISRVGGPFRIETAWLAPWGPRCPHRGGGGRARAGAATGNGHRRAPRQPHGGAAGRGSRGGSTAPARRKRCAASAAQPVVRSALQQNLLCLLPSETDRTQNSEVCGVSFKKKVCGVSFKKKKFVATLDSAPKKNNVDKIFFSLSIHFTKSENVPTYCTPYSIDICRVREKNVTSRVVLGEKNLTGSKCCTQTDTAIIYSALFLTR